MTLFAPLAPTAATISEVAAPATTAAQLAWPNSTASGIGAVGFDGVLAATGSTEQLPMASITKVITALAVMERHPITLEDHGPTIEYTAKDVAYFAQYRARGATVEPMQAGMRLTQYQAMQAMLLPSASNYTVSLVDWAFSSNAEFVVAANDWIARHGLTRTVVVEPTGLSPDNLSTVGDLIELGRIVLAEPVLAEIVSTAQVDLPGAGLIENSNDILGMRGIDGIKTGTLPEAGACLLFSADLEVGGSTVTLIGVALGGRLHDIQYPQILSLLQTVQASFHEVSLSESGQAFASYATEWGEATQAVASEARSVVVWGDTPISVSVHTDPVAAAPAGSPVGTATFTVGERNVEVPLVLEQELADPGPLWRLSNPRLLFG